MNIQQSVKNAINGDFQSLNLLIQRPFRVTDYQQVYQLYAASNVNEQQLYISLLNSKLFGHEAQLFSEQISINDIEEPTDYTLLNLLGKFIFRIYKLTHQNVKLKSQNLLLSFLQYFPVLQPNYLSLAANLNNQIEVNVAEIITRNPIENSYSLLVHYAQQLPRSKQICLNLVNQQQDIDQAFKFLLQLNNEFKFQLLKALSDSKFILGHHETVFQLVQENLQLFVSNLQQLDQCDDTNVFYLFFTDYLIILNNFVKFSLLIQAIQLVLTSHHLRTLEPDGQQFFHSCLQYVGYSGDIVNLVQNINQLPLAEQFYVCCNCFIDENQAMQPQITQIALLMIQQYIETKRYLMESCCACYLLAKTKCVFTDPELQIVYQYIIELIGYFNAHQNEIFLSNIYEFFDFTQVSVAGACKQLIYIISQNKLNLAAFSLIIANLYSFPTTFAYNLVALLVKKQVVISDLMSQLNEQLQFIVFTCLRIYENEEETNLNITYVRSVSLTEFQVVYFFQLLSNYGFHHRSIIDYVIMFLNRKIVDTSLAQLQIEAINEILVYIIYDDQSNIILSNIQFLTAFLLQQGISNDYLLIASELYKTIEEQQQVAQIIQPLFTPQLLQYIVPFFDTEQAIVRTCYDILDGLTYFQIDTFEVYVKITMNYLECSTQDTRNNVFELSALLARLSDEQIRSIMSTSIQRYSGCLSDQVIELLKFIDYLDQQYLYKQDQIRNALPNIQFLIQQ